MQKLNAVVSGATEIIGIFPPGGAGVKPVDHSVAHRPFAFFWNYASLGQD